MAEGLTPAPQQHKLGWEAEFNALSPEQQGKIRHCADRFGVPLIAAYYRAKDLDVIEDDPAPQPRAITHHHLDKFVKTI